MRAKGSIYCKRENNKGPKIDPWGTPNKTGADEEEQFPKFTEKVLFLR